MDIQRIQPLELSIDTPETKQSSGQDFKEMLNQGIAELNQDLQAVTEAQARYAAGEDVSLHEVMIKSQEAGISMRLAVTVRNQALDAYREIIRMQV